MVELPEAGYLKRKMGNIIHISMNIIQKMGIVKGIRKEIKGDSVIYK